MTTKPNLVQGTPGSLKTKKRGIRAFLTHQTLRRISQIGVASFITYLIIRNAIVGENSGVVTTSPEAYCPFGGLETLYKYITTGTSFISHTHLSNVVVLIAVLIVALLFRSAFCGWLCPLGFLQDLVSKFSGFLQKRIPIIRRGISSLKKKGARLAVLDRYLRYLKYLVLGWAVGGAAVFGFMVFKEFDPWSALISIAEFSFTPGLIVLIITLVASFFIERPWCRYACPLGAASGLLGKLSPTYLKRDADVCTSCKICTKTCPMGLKIHDVNKIKSVDCVTCLECVDACPVNGALEIKIGFPVVGK
ncbi:MAG: 4Fe-4S binding protein [Chloroflexi bacterium]|nr:4Fe-4S binding protein [Chloroflexota bacterium]